MFGPPRRNRIKLLLLMDVGGSMDSFTHLCERLFGAAHAANHFKQFEHRFFHNCAERQREPKSITTKSQTVEIKGSADNSAGPANMDWVRANQIGCCRLGCRLGCRLQL